MKKVIKRGDGELTIIGSNHWIEIDYDIPEWSDDESMEPCFRYRGNVYFLTEILRIDESHPWYELGFHGYSSDTYFSGIIVKLNKDCDKLQVYRYCY